jgi:hypothetical protein
MRFSMTTMVGMNCEGRSMILRVIDVVVGGVVYDVIP